MILSEVALGDTMDLDKGNFIKSLDNNYHSVRAFGKTYPDPSMAQTTADGVLIPLGKPMTDKNVRSELLHNEYIVYDESQTIIRYLLKLKFDFNKN